MLSGSGSYTRGSSRVSFVESTVDIAVDARACRSCLLDCLLA